MQLELAIVQACAGSGCRVRPLQDGRDMDTLYSDPIIHYQVDIRPGDLVVIDAKDTPPRTVFCFARAQVEGVQTRIRVDRHPQPQAPIEGLAGPIQAGDWVFCTIDRIYDLCVDGLPTDPDRLWNAARPMVESLVQSSVPQPEPEPKPAPARPAAPQQVEYLTAETERGRQALQTVMDRSYKADYEELPPEWTLVRVADGVPVSYISVVPDLELDMSATVIARSGSDEAIPTDGIRSAGIPYAFVNDVATREDRRREGHFFALMEHTYDRLRQAGYSLILLHGRYPLYRPLGFDVFTHHSGIFLTPKQIERALGTADGSEAGTLLRIEDYRGIQPDLLVVTKTQAGSLSECAAALRAAAALARDKGRDRILFEEPPAPCGKRYRGHACPETPLTALARTCGAEIRLQGADPESGTIPDADWIKVLDAAMLVTQALDCRPTSSSPPRNRLRSDAVHRRALAVGGGPRGSDLTLSLDTDAGAITLNCHAGQVTARPGIQPGATVLHWPSSALAQLVTGYRSPEALALLHGLALPPEAQALLSALFPVCWRFSRNESWTFGS